MYSGVSGHRVTLEQFAGLRRYAPRSASSSQRVALVTSSPAARLLSVVRGPLGEFHETPLSTTHDVRNSDGEQRAWKALTGALAA